MYAKRSIAPREPLFYREWRWKRYYIHPEGRIFDPGLVEASDSVVRSLRDQGEVTPEFSMGFSIIHSGLDMDFVIQGYWKNGNELGLKVYKTLPGNAGALSVSDANRSPVACVWDLIVISHERDSWVRNILAPDRPDEHAYFRDQLQKGKY